MKRVFGLVFALIVTFATVRLQAQETPSSQSPVKPQEIDRLRRQIEQNSRSSVEGILEYHTESGDLNQRLDFFRYGGLLNRKLGSSSSFQFTGTRANYMPGDSTFDQQGTNATVGIQTKLAESVEAHFEGGATRFSTHSSTLNGSASATYSRSDSTHIYGVASRTNVEESLLSATGVRPVIGPFAGQLVGRVMENRFVAGGSIPLIAGFDVFGEGGAGTRSGSNVPSNFFKTVSGGTGHNIVSRAAEDPLSLLRTTYEFTYFGFDQNRFEYGGASLLTRGGLPIAPSRIGSDLRPINPGVSNAGTGGYFSPKNFVSNVFRAEAKGGSDTRLSYQVSGFFGFQKYTGSSNRLADGISATVNVGITERIYVPVTYVIDNYGPFTQQSLYARLALRF